MKRMAFKSFLICLLVFLLNTSMAIAQVKAVDYKAKLPVLITSFGQSQDANLVDILAKRLNMQRSYQSTVFAPKIEWAKFKALIFVVGGSGKGLGSAGLDVQDELKRCRDILDEAKKRKLSIIAMHIGGEDRRGANSTPFLDFCREADIMVIKEDGNKDGYFTELSKKTGVRMVTVKTTMEVQDFLKTVFGL